MSFVWRPKVGQRRWSNVLKIVYKINRGLHVIFFFFILFIYLFFSSDFLEGNNNNILSYTCLMVTLFCCRSCSCTRSLRSTTVWWWWGRAGVGRRRPGPSSWRPSNASRGWRVLLTSSTPRSVAAPVRHPRLAGTVRRIHFQLFVCKKAGFLLHLTTRQRNEWIVLDKSNHLI